MIGLLCPIFVALGQNCSRVKNLDQMLVAKKVDLKRVHHVEFNGSKIVAQKNFKFVQVRDSYTFILLPQHFRASTVDFTALQKHSSQRDWHLDAGTPVVQVQCKGQGSDCQHFRCAKTCVSCGGTCAGQGWTVTTLPSDRVVIIPRYRKSGVDQSSKSTHDE